MQLHRIYADFNGLDPHADGASVAEMALTGYGTMASLARQKLRLTEGMTLLLYEPNDIECEAVAHFDKSRVDPAGRTGEWVARLDPREIHDSSQPEEISKEHPCICCGQDFMAQLNKVRDYTETCTNCGASVMAPLAPPSDPF